MSKPLVTLIVAVADTGVIGRDNTLPWHLPEDLKRFKRLTMGKPIVMGRKTYESIGKPLPGRQNIVLTRGANYRRDGVTVVHDIDAALRAAGEAPELIVRRSLQSNGRGRARIGGELVPIATLAEIFGGQLEISSQHGSQALRHAETHVVALDAYAGQSSLRD